MVGDVIKDNSFSEQFPPSRGNENFACTHFHTAVVGPDPGDHSVVRSNSLDLATVICNRAATHHNMALA